MSGRAVALQVLADVEWGGARAAAALDRSLAQDPTLSPQDRALATELVYGVLRHQGRLDHALAHHVKDGPRGLRKTHPTLRRILRIGAYQILLLDRIPPRAAVAEAVTAAKASPVRQGAAFVNAVLRALDRHGPPAVPEAELDPLGHLVHALSLPPWLAERFLDWFPAAHAIDLAEALLARPPITLRANRAVSRRAALQQTLAQVGPRLHTEPTPFAPEGLRVVSGLDPRRHPAHAAGAFVIQDEASQLVAHLLAPRPGQRVLDACAGRGGKTLHLRDLAGPFVQVVSVDRNRSALRALARRARRLRLGPAWAIQADWQAPVPLAPGAIFDAVLLDAPCSGLGALRRNPEIKWRLGPADLADLTARQQALLDAVAPLVRPGGTLVYAVCTLNPDEGPTRVAAFLERHPEFAPEAPGVTPEGSIAQIAWDRLLAPACAGLPAGVGVAPRPDRHDTDAFFMLRLRRLH